MNPVTATTPELNRQDRFTIAARLRRHRPLFAWAALLIVVNLPLLQGEVRESLLFIPEAVTWGQWWRVITYPLVHLSPYHLILDACGFLLLYAGLEEKRPLAKACYLAAPAAGSLLLALAMDPAVYQIGLSGLSGIAHGLMAVTALEMLRHKDQRTWGFVSLAIVVSKSAYELWSGRVLFEFMHMGLCGQPVSASHAGGVIGGLLTFLMIHAAKAMGAHQIQRTTAAHATPPLKLPPVQPLLRWMVRGLTRVMYRVRYEGLDHIPEKGPAVLVCNHVSYVDWMIIASACNRQVHFVMHTDIFNLPVLNWIFRMTGVIPIDTGRKNPAVLHQAFKEMAGVLQAGGLVCIFPEGRLTRTGRINRFRPGIEKIIRHTPVPVIPLALRGLWGSFFSHKDGGAMRCPQYKLGTRIELAAGYRFPPHQVTAPGLQYAVQNLHAGRRC